MGILSTMPFLMDGGSGWSVDNLLSNTTNKLGQWGGLIAGLIGIVMVIVGIFKIAKGLMSHGQGQVNWVLNILLIVIGALLVVLGVNLFTDGGLIDQFGQGAQDTLNDLGQGNGDGAAIVIDVADLGIETSF